MDEQTFSLIEALASLRASGEDLEEIKLANQKKVRTPEGVEKYDQPIGTIITKDMIEKAAKKAAQAATSSLHADTKKSTGSSASSSGSTSNASKTSVPNLDAPSAKKVATVPGNQTSADIDNFFVSAIINDPSKANLAWVQKKDGSWYQQTYDNGKIMSETKLDDMQVNALVAMEKVGQIYTGHIPDPEPKSKQQDLTDKIKSAFDSGASPNDSNVSSLIKQLYDLEYGAKKTDPKDETAPIKSESVTPEKTDAKTVKINGKDFKVGRYSRPKGFAKAFLIVHEDGTTEYENKTGARKKLTGYAFDTHYTKHGMNKFLTSDTGPIKKGEHFEEGKLVKDNETSAPQAPAAKVEPVNTPKPESKVDTPAEKPAQESTKPAPTPQMGKPEDKPASTESRLIKVGNLNLKPGRYTRPKGFAKVALILHPDGTTEYEQKDGSRKKITHSAFETHYSKHGINAYKGPDKKNSSEEVKPVAEEKASSESVKTPESSSVESPAIAAAKEAAATLKAKQELKKSESEPEAKSSTDSSENYVMVQGNKIGIPSGTKVFYNKKLDPDTAKGKYLKFSDGKWGSADKAGYHKFLPDGQGNKLLDKQLAEGILVEEGNKKSSAPEKKSGITVEVGGLNPTSYDFPEGSQVYVTSEKKSAGTVNSAFVIQPDGSMYKVGALTGQNEKTGHTKDIILEAIKSGGYVKWDKFHKDDKPEDNDKAGLFYVVVQGTPVHPVPAGTKVYKLGFLSEDETKAKYYKDEDGNWHQVTHAGESSANKAFSESLDHYLEGGDLVEDGVSSKDGKAYVGSIVTDKPDLATKAVEENEEISPAASPTEVKSVKISGMDIKPGKYSIGKGFAKAFLLVHPDGTTEYVNKKGESKKLTPAAFKKNWDAGMNHYAGPLDAAKGPTQSDAAPTQVHGLKPGTYYTKQFDTKFNPDVKNQLEVMEDGSAVFHSGDNKLSMDASMVQDTLKYGTILDEFGNSVVLPNGTKPEKVQLFGSTKGFTVDELDSFRNDLVKGEKGILSTMQSHSGGLNVHFLLAYSKKYFPGDASGNKKSLIKAIDDIKASMGSKQAHKPGLDGAIDSPAKSLFKQDDNGYFVKPDVLTEYENKKFHYLSSSEANQAIKKISQAFDGKIASAPSKMSYYGKPDWYQAYLKGDFKLMYQIEENAGMKMSPDHPGAPANKDTHKIKWAPSVAGELPAGVLPEGTWTYDSYHMSDAEIDNYLIAANMANPTHLTASEKKYWVAYHMQGDTFNTDIYSLKAKNHAESYPNNPYTSAPVWTEGIKPKKSYTDFVDGGEQVSYWSNSAIKEYVKDYPEVVPAGMNPEYPWDYSNAIQNHVDTAKAEQAAKEAAELAEKMKPKFQKVPGQGVSGGHHEAMVLQDQFGQKWVYKPRDDNNIFLADVEQAAHELAWAWGYKTSKSFITDFDDRKGHVQQMFDAESDMGGVSMSSLTPSQVQDIAKEHLLDWALDNDDSWSANLLKLKNGSIVGIDKGRAFVGMGHWNGLTADSQAHVHMPLVYTDLYNAIANKQISQEDANAAYFAVLKQARKMEKLSDARMTQILEEGFKNRKNWTVSGGPNSKEGAIQAALDRKNSLVNDMETLWGNVFKKAGYDKPEAPDNIVVNPADQDIHLGITPAAIEQAKENKSYGASVFFSGPEIEDSHLLLYHTKTKGGIDQLNGEMKIRESSKAYTDVEKWLKDHAVEVGNAHGFTPDNMKPTLPNEDDYWQKIIAGVKTISAHALDGQYNEGSLNGLSWVKNTLQNYVDDYDNKMSNPVTQADMVKQYKDPKAFLEMSKQYLGFIHKAEEHKANGTKSTPGEFSQYVWTPPKKEEPEPESGVGVKVELRKASSAKAVTNGVPKFEEDGTLQHHAGYTTDGNIGNMYLVTLPTGETIEFRGNTTKTPAASKGLTRFTMPAGADEAASLERIRAQMAEMGLEMNDASEDDLELFYWRHLSNIMDDRADSKKTPSLNSKSTSKYKKFQDAKPIETAKMSPAEEIEAWRNAFSNITSRQQIDEFVASGGHLPKFGHYDIKNPDKYMGQPFWERFDVTDDMVNSKQFLGGAFYTNEAAKYVVDTGGMMATESRLRTLGMWMDGMSSSSDMGHGSSQFVFIRQNKNVTENSSDYGLQHIYYSPNILKRTHNYAYDSDQFGEMKLKSTQSYFDFDSMASHTGSGNEVMIKHHVSLLDDIEIVTFEDPKFRTQVIQQLKDAGITEIRGVPVEKRFVMRNKKDIADAQKVAREAWNK